MSLFARAQLRSAPAGAYDIGEVLRRARGMGPAGPGVAVGPERATQAIALWASCNFIASVISTLPLDEYTGEGTDRRQIPTERWLDDPDGSGAGFEDWMYQVCDSVLKRGNVVGRIGAFDRLQYPTLITVVHPDQAFPRVRSDTGAVEWTIDRRAVPRDQVWHRRAFPVPGQVLGLSPVQHHAASIGLGLAAQQFGAQFFSDGAHPTGVLSTDKPVGQGGAKAIKERFMAATSGNREPAVLGSGMKFQAIQVSPNESQFLETQRYAAADTARIYGPGIPELLGYETHHGLTYTNIEGRSLDLLKYSMGPWITRFERWLSGLLPRTKYLRFNRDALLASTTLERYRVHALALQNHIRVPNEVRELEDLPPTAWGNDPLEKAGPEPTEDDKTPTEGA
ncbi:phage portal protein [Pseudonocardia alni]|uniref:phage portal protein n=1 Tax=Pseudonocardia alni TaxID=33907 RepID=UPI0027A6647C|nr:phage portal protein [Pseudonocardia alni]